MNGTDNPNINITVRKASDDDEKSKGTMEEELSQVEVNEMPIEAHEMCQTQTSRNLLLDEVKMLESFINFAQVTKDSKDI